MHQGTGDRGHCRTQERGAIALCGLLHDADLDTDLEQKKNMHAAAWLHSQSASDHNKAVHKCRPAVYGGGVEAAGAYIWEFDQTPS